MVPDAYRWRIGVFCTVISLRRAGHDTSCRRACRIMYNGHPIRKILHTKGILCVYMDLGVDRDADRRGQH